MKTYEFQPHRSDVLRHQLVEMPAQAFPKKRTGESPAGLTPGLETADQETRKPHRTRRVLLTVVAVSLGVFVLGQTNMSIQSAHAAGVLRSAAEHAMTFSDPVPGTGEYLLIHTHANWLGGSSDAAGNDVFAMNVQTIDVYVPGDPSRDSLVADKFGLEK